MKILLSLSALLITLTLTAQENTATWYLNDTSGNGIQSNNNTASGDYSTAMGIQTTASGNYSTAMGAYTTASGNYSTAMGVYTTASGGMWTAMGYYTTASGDYSTAMGYQTEASDRSSLVIGEYNLLGSTVTNSASLFSTENTAFVIGNGTNWGNRSDALTVLFDGTTTIAGDLSINSDARLKANIISLGSTLAKVLQIDGKTYTMKKDENKKQKIGVLAQDIEKVFPELVSESNGVKSVNYQGLVPVLINALKEQAIESTVNLATDALRGNDMSESFQGEFNSIRENAANSIESLRKPRKRPKKRILFNYIQPRENSINC